MYGYQHSTRVSLEQELEFERKWLKTYEDRNDIPGILVCRSNISAILRRLEGL